MRLRQETQLAVTIGKADLFKYNKTRQCHTRQYIEINQSMMPSILEKMQGSTGIMISHIN